MTHVLPITGEYPADWKAISDRVWAEAGHRCVRCLHPYRKGEHGNGEWSPCDSRCVHGGPICLEVYGVLGLIESAAPAWKWVAQMESNPGTPRIVAHWRVGTVHHLDGNKANCAWWNLLPLCQRCHLKTQARVNPHQPYLLEHSDWFKPYVCGFYAHKYEGRQITREEAVRDQDRLLALERIT